MDRLAIYISRIIVGACMALYTSCVVFADQASTNQEQVLLALEKMASEIAENPGNCDAVRAQAKQFNEQHSDALQQYGLLTNEQVDDKTQTRLDTVVTQLAASALVCGSCSDSANLDKKSGSDPCKDTKRKCERNCPLSGWSCAQHWAGCMSGYRPSCCWAGACGSKKNCMRVCESSCVCSI